MIESITKQFNEEAAKKQKKSSKDKVGGDEEKSDSAKTGSPINEKPGDEQNLFEGGSAKLGKDEKSDEAEKLRQYEGGSQNLNKVHLLIQKIENSITLINNSKKLAAKHKNKQIGSKFEVDGLRAIENYEKVLNNVELIIAS